ncbi:hypothetical protein PIB30_083107 [Stylosanthes scabra]|uniref:Uncharacterized protein n=1 Tax=Stylosanthes scabra TaxID=79078 RepID=A0ABU6STK1_9FABA|nr:hypothetical protein [Stylosanthes scabra]
MTFASYDLPVLLQRNGHVVGGHSKVPRPFFWPPKGMTYLHGVVGRYYGLFVQAKNFEPGCDDANSNKEDYQMVATNDFCKEIAVDPHFSTQFTMEFIEKRYMTFANNLIKAEYLDGFLTADRFTKTSHLFGASLQISSFLSRKFDNNNRYRKKYLVLQTIPCVQILRL